MDKLDKKMSKNEQNEQKMSACFRCNFCDYNTLRRMNYDRHILSRKHQRISDGQLLDNKNEQNEQNEHCNPYQCVCGNIYIHQSGLSKHKKKCKAFDVQNTSCNISKSNIFSLTHNINNQSVNTLTSIVLEVVKQNQELTNKLVHLCSINTNVTHNTQINDNSNSNNKTFNLNMFLNEKCKDAMNITDFIDSLQLQLSDLEDVGKLGYINGISNIIVKNLNAMDIHKRPVHCADKKREIIYIKDKDKWEKENTQKNKLRNAIKCVAFKNERLLPKFKELHPDCNYSDSKYSEQYSKLVIEAMGGLGNNDVDKQNKIIKNIAKEVLINKL